MTVPFENQLNELKRGVDEILVEKDLIEKIKTGKPLTVKVGFDPTAPDIHLGHTVLMRKMAQFQKFGHEVIFLIGDFTGLVGDPSGRTKTRPQLTREEIAKNADTYKKQIFKILDPQATKVLFNSEWLGKLTAFDFVKLASHANVARLLEREDFHKRYKEGNTISLHEFIYPLLQAYDSVYLKADIELGGRDQKFNLLLGRELMRDYGLPPQVCLTMPLLEGLDGIQKMSKSYGNYVGVDETPDEIYGKLMSLPDSLMERYYQLLSAKSSTEISELFAKLKNQQCHPKQVKSMFASEIVERYYSPEIARSACEKFDRVFSKKEIPDDIPQFNITTTDDGTIWVPKVLVDIKFAPSTSEGKRLVSYNAVKLDHETVATETITVKKGEQKILQCGKRRFARLVFS